MVGEQYRDKEREAIQGGGKKLLPKPGSSAKEKQPIIRKPAGVLSLWSPPSLAPPSSVWGRGRWANAVRALKSSKLLWQPPGTLCLQGNGNVTA